MQTRSKVLAAVGALAIASGIGFGIGVAQANQPHMESALGDLQAAKGELQIAMADKGGHRVAAIGLVNQAITQVQAGIAVGDGY